ncbi:MAG TPA: acetoacetate--CoA ligase [Solirubrobacteraceae bacterium]|nr:acetoacetate--CoA ligase [Solirubrobacteraceae bacterium]
MSVPPILWSPSAELRASTNLARYIAGLRARRGMDVSTDDYAGLWRWSVDELDAFWMSIWEHFDVVADGTPAVALADASMPGAVWFPGTRLNYAEHVFRGVDDAAVAVIEAGELRATREVTWGELRALTAQIAGGLRALGVGPGDRVAAYMPNILETLAALLATASIGAVWSSCSPDFGERSVVDRFAQIEPKVLLAVDGYRYGGRDFDKREVLAGLIADLPTVEHAVVLGYLDGTTDRSALPRALGWEELLARGAGTELTFERVPFDHPLWVLYSSGTTGLPKAIVQGQGGILLEQLKKLSLHLDARPGDRVFWFTTTGWMMWNFLAGVLLTDASIILFDGNPGHPTMDRLWDLAAQTRMTCFGTSASYLAACMKAGVEPGAGRDLSALRAVGSTGSPLSPEGFRWVYEHLGEDTWLFSTSGGTDVCTAFVGGCPLVPVYEGELQARALGARVEAFDEQGRSLVGEVGELVLTAPMPSMPLYFWNDPDGERYRESYFDMYPGIWRHGDWIEITDRGTAIIYGRSDSTINRGGIRMGTSEIYRAVLADARVTDALVVDVPDPDPSKDSWMALFVVLAGGATLDDGLRRDLAREIRETCSPRHVPDEVFAVAEVPRTLSGKVLEVPVKRILMGHDPAKVVSRDSLANPAALDWFVELAATRS